MRPIDADAFSEQYGSYYAEQGTEEGFIGTVNDLIVEQPTIEAEPVRHGRWILERRPDGTPYCLHCSECDPDFAVIYNQVATGYCPDCGAKMENDRVYERDDYDDTD